MDQPTLNPAEFAALIETMRPELHRYATRMTGSVIDGEDVVQEALVKAYASLNLLTHDTNVRGWLFRITHNKAIDYLRRSSNEPLELLDDYPLTETPDQPLEAKELASFAMTLFLKLAPRQRSCVILKDVLCYSLAEISELMDATVPEIKAILHRGRTRLRELAASGESAAPRLDARERELLERYVERFNARDFEALGVMLADDARLELYGRVKLHSAAEIRDNYFTRYREVDSCRLALGIVEGRLALLAYDQTIAVDTERPAYFMLITWEADRVTVIRDYRYVVYVMREAVVRGT